MDSIGDNVMAIICVVVGILIIGCALVPIVDNASVVETENTVVEPIGGTNTITESGTAYMGPLKEVTIVADGTTLTVNGDSQASNLTLFQRIGSDQLIWFSSSTYKMIIYPALSGEESQATVTGTATYSNGQLTVTGTDSNNDPYTLTAPLEPIYVNSQDAYQGAQNTEIYGLTTGTFIIGANQMAVSQSGATTITLETETLPSSATMTLSEDGSYATITTTSAKWWVPLEWTGTTTTTETTTADSEYKALYSMIPVLCILGMAYVLIRRFY